MPIYLVETYLTRAQAPDRLAREVQARSAAAELRRAGAIVRFHFAIHVPEDELCFFVFDAASPDQAALAALRTGLDPIRLVEAVATEGIEKARGAALPRIPSSHASPGNSGSDPGAWNRRNAMKTTIAIIAAVVMSATVVSCGADQSNDQAKPVNQTVQPHQATRSSADLPSVKGQGAGPRCRDPQVCVR